VTVAEVFRRLQSAGLIARMNWRCCLGCGTAAMWTELRKQPQACGWAFFHRQDAAHYRKSGRLYVAYGARPGCSPDTAARVGQFVQRVFRDCGFAVEWDGSPESRILARVPDGARPRA
jgi:hypothetical protein